MFVSILRVVPPFRRSPSRGSKKVSVKKIDVIASCGTLEVRRIETQVCIFFFVHATERVKKGLNVHGQVSRKLIDKQLICAKLKILFRGYLLFLLITVVVIRQYALIKQHKCF